MPAWFLEMESLTQVVMLCNIYCVGKYFYFVLLGAYGKVSEGVWKDPSTNIEKRVAIKTLRSKSSLQPSPALP